MHRVTNIAQCAQMLRQGIANRITSATTMNVHSSRSHAVFTLYLQVRPRRPAAAPQCCRWSTPTHWASSICEKPN